MGIQQGADKQNEFTWSEEVIHQVFDRQGRGFYMKQPKSLTRTQKEYLSANGLNWKEWALQQEMQTKIIVRHKVTGMVKAVNKKGK